MNISMVAAGDLFTVDCDTFPGGYLRNDTPGQFSTYGFPSRREVAKVFAARGLKTLYLEAETPLPASEPPSRVVPPDVVKWREEHAKIRTALQDWQAILAGLALHAGENITDRKAALAALRMTMHFFKTYAMDHCRREENSLFQHLRIEPGFGQRSSRHFATGMSVWGSTWTSLKGRWPPINSPAIPPCCSPSENAPSANWASTLPRKRSLRASWSAVTAATAFRPLSMRRIGPEFSLPPFSVEPLHDRGMSLGRKAVAAATAVQGAVRFFIHVSEP